MTPVELALNDMAQTMYRDTVRTIAPVYPWVLVYVLPRELAPLGVIILPADTGKTTLEGVVLQTWGRYPPVDGRAANRRPTESALKAGDHVLFQHYAGMPYGPFRLVCEVDRGVGDIIAVVEREPKGGVSALAGVINSVASPGEGKVAEICRAIQDQFILVNRKTRAVSVSAFGQDK